MANEHVEPVGHTVPHAPQLFESVVGLTHMPLQGVLPVAHDSARHEPITQAWLFAHAVPQAPQFVRLVARSTHAVPQSIIPVVHIVGTSMAAGTSVPDWTSAGVAESLGVIESAVTLSTPMPLSKKNPSSNGTKTSLRAVSRVTTASVAASFDCDPSPTVACDPQAAKHTARIQSPHDQPFDFMHSSKSNQGLPRLPAGVPCHQTSGS
jgi:hypothetical protein